MKEDRFIKENTQFWNDLEVSLKKYKSGNFKHNKKNELENMVASYNRLCSHLSYARTNFGETATTAYLNRLAASAHALLYTNRTSNLKSLGVFLLYEFPAMIKTYKWYFVVSASMFILGSVLSYIYTMISPDNASAFLPQQILGSINYDNQGGRSWDGTVISSLIFTNNIRAGLTAFALGITLGSGTIYTLAYNGIMLGTIGALEYQHGIFLGFWALILPHGILELFSIFVCGAAGLMIGYSIINPGKYSRKDSFILKGKDSVKLVLGTLPLFVAAGLIEGFFTPSGAPDAVKYLFAAFTLVLLIVYLFLPFGRRKRNRATSSR